MKRSIVLFFLLGQCCIAALAQSEDILERYFNTLATEEELESGSIEDITERLIYLLQHPKNINEATREDFEALPFLTDLQVEKLCEYLYHYAPLRSVGSLAMIPAIDSETRDLLNLCFTFDEVPERDTFSLGKALRNGTHDIVATGKIPFYTRKGDEYGYLGARYAHSLRYTFKYGDKLSAGIIGANDNGEPLFKHGNEKGYDHYAIYAQIKNIGRLKHAIVGHYRIRLGQGLTFNSNFSLGKLTQQNVITRSTAAISPHASKMQYNFLQGAAATVALSRHFELTAFASSRAIDATLSKDGKKIQTILNSGYHRTSLEMQKKHNAHETIVGGHLTFDTKKGFVFGINAVYDKLNKPLSPDKRQIYRKYYPTGDTFSNYSVDYSYRSHKFSVAGETAIDKDGALATLNHLLWRPLSNLQINVSQRFYAYKYNALHAEAFNEGGSVKNESGVYVNAQWQPSARLSLMAYTDYAYFAWDKYQAKGASKCIDNLIQATYKLNGVSLFARYRFKARQITPSQKNQLWWRQEHRGRLNATYKLKAVDMRTQVDVSHYQLTERSFGWMASQQATYAPTSWLILSATFAYFHTEDYSSRVYLWEKQPLYSIYIPAYQGQGIRYSLFAWRNRSIPTQFRTSESIHSVMKMTMEWP